MEESIGDKMKWKPYIQVEQYYWQMWLGTKNNDSYIIKICPSIKKRKKRKGNNNNQVTTIINIIK